MVIVAQSEYKALLKEREDQAAIHVGMSPDNYEKSKADTMADPLYLAQIQKHDLELAKSDVAKSVTEPRAEIK